VAQRVTMPNSIAFVVIVLDFLEALRHVIPKSNVRYSNRTCVLCVLPRMRITYVHVVCVSLQNMGGSEVGTTGATVRMSLDPLWPPNAEESTIMTQLSISCQANRNALYFVFIIVIS